MLKLYIQPCGSHIHYYQDKMFATYQEISFAIIAQPYCLQARHTQVHTHFNTQSLPTMSMQSLMNSRKRD